MQSVNTKCCTEVQTLFFLNLDAGPVTLVVPVAGQSNTFVIGLGRTLAILTWDGRNNSAVTTEVIASVEENKPQNRFNDGKADRSGRLWAGKERYLYLCGVAGLLTVTSIRMCLKSIYCFNYHIPHSR